jgi:hypothetical protein
MEQARVSEAHYHNFQSFLISYKTKPLHADLACTISLEALFHSILGAFGRLLSKLPKATGTVFANKVFL